MAEAKMPARVTIINQKEGKLVLPPDPEELKKDPKAKDRVVFSGHSLEVSADEAAKLLNHRGVVDAAKLLGSAPNEAAKLRAELADLKAENEKLRRGAPADEAADELGDGDEVLTQTGDRGVIVKMKRKGRCDVKLENGNTSDFALKSLKAAPPVA